jgi:hypothetical protein
MLDLLSILAPERPLGVLANNAPLRIVLATSREAIFLRMLLDEINFLPAGPSNLYCDNDATIRLAEDQVRHSKCKHICLKYHYMRNQVLAKE